MHRLTRLLLALLPALLLLGAWEFALRATAEPERDTLHLSRGFDPSARYLVPDPDVSGGWRTQIFGGEHIASEVVIPPKENGPRVILLGGSNTELLPDFILQEELRARDERAWEVINLGRRGYGSERVRILLDQALELRPDLLVIYSGHNEFVERGFASEVAERRGAAWLPRLHVVEQVRDWFARARPPEVLDRRDPGLRATQPAETTRHLEAYAANLRHMARAAHARGIPVLLCTPLGNPLVAPYVDTLPDSLSEADAERVRRALADARRALPPRLFGHLRVIDKPALRLRVRSWFRPGDPDTLEPLASVPRARPLLGRFAEAPALDRGDPTCDSMEGSHWPPVRSWQPEVHQMLRVMVALLGRTASAEERAALESTLPHYAAALALVPDHAGALYDLGLVRWLLDEDPAEAVRLLLLAAASDRAPRAANDRTNGLVRDVAASEPGVTLHDFEAEARAATADGLPGFELLMDNCHLQPGVRVLLMQRLAEQLPALLP